MNWSKNIEVWEVSLLNFEGGPEVPLLNFGGGPWPGAQQGGEGGGGSLPCPILKTEEKCPDFVKNALTVSSF